MQDKDRFAEGEASPSVEIEHNLRAAGLYQRWTAMNELATYPATVAVPIFKRLLTEKDVGLRRMAIVGLGKHLGDETFEVLQAILESGGDPIILAEAANSIFDFGDVAIPILQQLFDRSSQAAQWQIRQTVISLLVETEYYDVLLAVATSALSDETKAIQELGILALKQVLRSPLQESALELLATLADNPDWHIRWCTAISLHDCPEPQARQLIAQLQRDEDFRVVGAALEGVGIEDRDID
jgi:HEAT repeat protein